MKRSFPDCCRSFCYRLASLHFFSIFFLTDAQTHVSHAPHGPLGPAMAPCPACGPGHSCTSRRGPAGPMAGVRPGHCGGGAPRQGRLEGGDPRDPRDPRAGDASEELRIRAPGERHAGGKLD